MKKIAILGSTGSIGTQTLEVVRENGDIEVLGLAAGKSVFPILYSDKTKYVLEDLGFYGEYADLRDPDS